MFQPRGSLHFKRKGWEKPAVQHQQASLLKAS